jgi:hypothetical protein
MHDRHEPHEPLGAPDCGLCGNPITSRLADRATEFDPLDLPGQWVEYVVVDVRGALVRYQVADGSAGPRKTVATTLTQALGIGLSDLPGARFTCWEAPAPEGGTYQSAFTLV